MSSNNERPSQSTDVAAIKAALGLTPSTVEKHARHNLCGALIDIQHRDGVADAVCIRTINRVLKQLADVEDIINAAR